MEIMSQPVVDGDLDLSSPAFLPADPRALVESGEYLREVDLLLGVNSEEGILITQFLQALPALYPAVAAAWPTIGPFALFARHHTEATDLDRQLAEEVLGHYV